LQGTGFFALQSCANHSCRPNAAPLLQPDGSMQLVALRQLEAGEEVTISYIDEEEPLALRQAHLADYGFACTCSLCRCTALTD
jgi:SET domain-containing protein